MRRALVRLRRAVWITLGFALIGVGGVGVLLPTHLLGALLVVGLILVLRNSPLWRRRFVTWQRHHPRWGVPLRRLLRTPPEVAPVIWHEVLRTERWVLPRAWRRLARWRRRLREGARRRRGRRSH